jgi:hypothetical protein
MNSMSRSRTPCRKPISITPLILPKFEIGAISSSRGAASPSAEPTLM